MKGRCIPQYRSHRAGRTWRLMPKIGPSKVTTISVIHYMWHCPRASVALVRRQLGRCISISNECKTFGGIRFNEKHWFHVVIDSVAFYCSRASLRLPYGLSPSPTRRTFATRRSMSPIAMRPSSLSGVKRKFELEENYVNSYSPPPFKRIFSERYVGLLCLYQPFFCW